MGRFISREKKEIHDCSNVAALAKATVCQCEPQTRVITIGSRCLKPTTLCFSFDVRNPLEVSEEFIQQFNDAETFEEKERYEEMARKMLERAKVS